MELKRKGKQEGCTTPDSRRKEGQSGSWKDGGRRKKWVGGRPAGKQKRGGRQAERRTKQAGRYEVTDGAVRQASNKRGGRQAESGAGNSESYR